MTQQHNKTAEAWSGDSKPEYYSLARGSNWGYLDCAHDQNYHTCNLSFVTLS